MWAIIAQKEREDREFESGLVRTTTTTSLVQSKAEGGEEIEGTRLLPPNQGRLHFSFLL